MHQLRSWLKFDADWNMYSTFVTLEMSHDEMSLLNTFAQLNK